MSKFCIAVSEVHLLYFYISLHITSHLKVTSFMQNMFSHVVYKAFVCERDNIMHILADITHDNNRIK